MAARKIPLTNTTPDEMAATPTELAAASECIDRCIPDGQKWSVIIYLLASVAGVSADPTTLVANAVCIDTCIPQGLKPAVVISLLNSIQSGLAPSDQVSCGHGAPVSTPTAGCSLYVDLDSTALYYWDGAAWQLKV